jgi:hypothetical protein
MVKTMFDMMAFFRQAANNDPMAVLRQFNLNPQQSTAAMETMMPLIAAAFQRQLADPHAAAQWLELAKAMPAVKVKPTDAQMTAAAKLLGSREVADALADQIAASSGIGQAVAKAMLPWATALMVGSVAAASAKPGNEFEEIAEAMKPVLATIPNPIGPKSFADDTFGAFVRGFNRGRPETPPEPELTDAEKLLASMVEAGRQAHAAQTEAFDSFLDNWFGGSKKA